MEYKMIDEVTLKNFKRSMRSGIPLREFGPQGAFDSKPRARDDDPDDKPAPSAIAGMIALRDKMSPEGFKALCMSLCDEDGAEDGEQFETPEERNDAKSFPDMRKAATDEPPPFKGRPRTGGAMDAMAFDKLSAPRRTKAERSFDAMYPGAGDIKLNSDSYPRVGFIVTNMARRAENVVAFYNKRGTYEQWIKEGKGAIKWTRFSCRSFAANAVRLQLHALAHNLSNFLRTLATPEPIKDWSLTSLKEKLIKIGAKVISHGRYVAFQMAEVAIPRNLFADFLRLIAELRPPPVTSTA